MGIYLPNMEMPKSCGKCFVGNREICVNGCPLIPIPPHRDLIDREWLVDIALHLMNTAKNDDIANGVKWMWQYIIDAPTIIMASEEAE